MILGLAAAFIISAALLLAVNRYELPEIPIYLVSGMVLSFLIDQALEIGLISASPIEEVLMRELAFLGLGVMVFFATTRFVLDKNRSTSLDSFKASMWISMVSFAGFAGALSFIGLGFQESLLFGFAAAFSSSLIDSKVIEEEARSNHIHGWLTEDFNLYQDIVAVLAVSCLAALFTGSEMIALISGSLLFVSSALILRKKFSDVALKITGQENELIMLLGVSTLVSMVLISEQAGLTALPGLIAAGLLFTDTELGFEVRERLSSIKDFFTAIAFFSIGGILQLPGAMYLAAAVGLTLFVVVVRPLLTMMFLELQGYDLRTSFLVGAQTNEVSEVSALAALIFSSVIGSQAFSAIAVAFTASIVLSHLSEFYSHQIFERVLSEYEFNSEKESLPAKFEDHVIIAGFDHKTQGLIQEIPRQVIVIDYDLERIIEAEESGVFHILGDLNSTRTWERAKVSQASIIVSAVESVPSKLGEIDTEAEKILVTSERDSKEIEEELKKILSEKIE